MRSIRLVAPGIEGLGYRAHIAKEPGCDEVIESKTGLAEEVEQVDLVFDTAGGETLNSCVGVVRSGGRLVSIAEEPPEQSLQAGIQALHLVVEPNREQPMGIAKVVDRGAVRPRIDSVFPLADAAQAFAHSMRRATRGKVVRRMHDA
jgi:NADPH:quinone reductase-like Zn-dependent oxidoreductase